LPLKINPGTFLRGIKFRGTNISSIHSHSEQRGIFEGAWIKLLKVLPYWLIFLIIAVGAQATGFLMSKNNIATAKNQPQVLGASTGVPSIRGADSEARLISQINFPDLSDVNAKSYLVFDLASGQTLLAKNSGQKFAIASLTKLMTALVAYSNTDLNQDFVISDRDILNVKPNLGLIPGDSVRALDIFNAMLIGSCNDAAKALADYTTRVSGSDFVGLMNQKDLGLQNTSYQNPMGFDNSGNYSTADDLKILITQEQKLSVFTDLGRRINYEFLGSLGKAYYTSATNKLIQKYPDIQAIKTGWTNEASGAMATKVDIGGREVVILVLDSQSRESDTLKLKAALESSFDWQ
jgi:D-alanyl-D-alanine carboxypeptidase